ncbi:NADP-dependent oxidoreductase [Aquibacillus kalidii]|uniref:NADP-dependent oxidoreductase n=1 Tax=Aquibacillus kalidii TaxID=2762597 RepID=UPI0016457B98|nr:NADP-dependent oxidoreductase [Aquibacillus kalidii]
MKAIVIDQYGGKDLLTEREISVPAINENQVLVELHATSINPIDWKLREGYLKQALPFEFPIVLGWDLAGVVKAIGDKVQSFKIGDEVYARPATTRMGTYAEFAAVDEELLATKPNNLSFEEAASVPLAGLTAWQCLVDFGNIQKGDKVLVHAGAGGVGTFAIQIAKYYGAYVATTVSGKNIELAERLGADLVINYQEQDFSTLLEDYDLVVDTLGGVIQEKSFSILKKGGKLASIVQNPSEEIQQKYEEIDSKLIWLNPNGKQLGELGALIEDGYVQPIVGTVFPFSEQGLKDAHELSETHHAKGKIVISIKE